MATARPKSCLARKLLVEALPLDDVQGNHDGALDPGETALFRVRVTNTGQGASYDTLLTVDLGKSLLTLDRKLTYLGWLPPHASKTVVFRLTAPPIRKMLEEMDKLEKVGAFRDVEATTPANLAPENGVRPIKTHSAWRQAMRGQTATLRVSESGTLAAVSEAKVFNAPPLPAVLKIAQREIEDGIGPLSYGNGNGQLDAGETVVMRLLLNNIGLSSAEKATANLSSNTKDVLVVTARAPLKNLTPFGGRNVEFSLRVARQLKNDKLKLTTYAPKAPVRTEIIELSLRPAPPDTTPPTVLLSTPPTRIATTVKKELQISGAVADPSDLKSFSFHGQMMPFDKLQKAGPNRYRFWFSRKLKMGENVFPITATDNAGNSVTLAVRVIRKPG